MRRSFAALVLFVIASTASAAETARYIVATRGGVNVERARQILNRDLESQSPAASVGRNIVTFRIIDGFAADLTADEVAKLKKSPNVEYIEPVLERHAFKAPGRNYSGQTIPWGIARLQAPNAWAAHRAAEINVVVLDTGLDYTHPDLKFLYAGGFNFLTGQNDPMDDNGHGTHVAGTIAAADDNGGVVGVAQNVRLWAGKVLNSKGSGNTEKEIQGLDYFIAKKNELGGNWVVNLSLGSSQASTAERRAFERAVAAGMLIVAATGNESTATVIEPVAYPAAYPNVIAVGAIDETSKIASFSNQGAEVDFVAPGVEVLSTVPIGFGSKSYVASHGQEYFATTPDGTPQGTVTGEYVFCGFGRPEQIPSSVAGKIALIRRGDGLAFAEKSRNAKEKGAIAVVIYNREDFGETEMTGWTLRSTTDYPWSATYEFPLTVGMTWADGEELAKRGTGTLTAANDIDDYDFYQGTSMASPHVAGAAALLWSLAPTATPAQITNALISTASDLGKAGQDTTFGYGIVDVFAAAKTLAPDSFGSPVKPGANKPTTGRAIGRRR